MTFRIAVVQPIAHPIGEDEKNVDDAVDFITRAEAEGADFVCFPETYPGPWRMPAQFDPTPRWPRPPPSTASTPSTALSSRSATTRAPRYNLICMAFGDGRAPVSYRRTHPNGPWIYTGGKWWEFQYVAGNDFPVFDTRARQGRPRNVQRDLHAGGDARTGVARRRVDLHAGRHRQG